ncbi:kinase-like domain-containing protein [Pavlovales sp. CCMP2436]|nr:kinase-like domain-containing protein [Pavlovales sp. CCMP2436]
MNAYTKLRSLQRSTAAEVFPLEDRFTNAKFVMKQLLLSPRDREAAIREVQLLSSLHHPNICEYFTSFLHKGDSLCLLMPYCSNGNLAQLFRQRRERMLPPLDEAVAVHYVTSVALACEYLHARRIIHRDIKPQNIFLSSDWTVRLGDLGVARQLNDSASLASTCVGTPLYMSPELLQSNKYSKSTDLWALGCVAFELLSLTPAFSGATFNDVAAKVIGGQYGRLPARASAPYRSAVGRLLSVDKEERPSAKQLLNPLLLRRPLRAHLARMEGGGSGFAAAAGYDAPLHSPPSESPPPPGPAESGAAPGVGVALPSRAARRASAAAEELPPPMPRRGSSGGVASADLATSERMRRALSRCAEIQRYLLETQQRRRSRFRAEITETQVAEDHEVAGALRASGEAIRVAEASGEGVQRRALCMLETGAAPDYSSAITAAQESFALETTLQAARPAAIDEAGGALVAELLLEEELGRTPRECELTVQLLSLESAATEVDDDVDAQARLSDLHGPGSRSGRRRAQSSAESTGAAT